MISKEKLQRWVDYANEEGSLILFDAAYEGFISDPALPHTIYECEGAKKCCMEFRSYSKTAGFTGVRLGYTVIPKEIENIFCKSLSRTKKFTKTAFSISRRHPLKYWVYFSFSRTVYLVEICFQKGM